MPYQNVYLDCINLFTQLGKFLANLLSARFGVLQALMRRLDVLFQLF